MKRTTRYSRKYVPSIDGLRALAVIAVIAYHLNFSWAKGGFIGVDIFFVLSGYLITNILLTQWEKTQSLQLKQFWIRRFRRLIPAVYVMIVVVVIYAVFFHPEILKNLRGDAIASFFYVSNWWFIFHDVSYFDSFGLPSPLKNLWSLAIEEQFYMIWPAFLLVFLKWVKNPKLLLKIVIGLGLLSAIWMTILYVPGTDPSRVYYGTDTRAFDLLAGCALAFVWPFTRLSPVVPKKSKAVLNIAGTISILGFILFTAFVSEYQPFLYRGGLLFVAILGVIMIATISHPASYLSKIFSFKPLRWIGTRSYGIYLWHYPIITLTTPVVELTQPNIWRAILQVAATFIIAELSFRFIETPIRKNGFISYFKGFKDKNYFVWKNKPVGKWLSLAGLVAVLAVFALGMSNVVSVNTNAEKQQTSVKTTTSTTDDTKKDTEKETEDKAAKEKEASKDTDTEKASGQDETQEPDNKDKSVAPTPTITQTVAIGDSVMLDIEPYLKEAVPNVTIDGLVGRQLRDAITTATGYKKFNTESSSVILELGTNGPFTADQLDSLLDQFDKATIYLVNTRVPRGWQADVNKSIANADSRPNVTVVDWYSQSSGQTQYFAPDGVHLTKTGAQAYVAMLMNVMKK
ncbi:acetyltransferase [Listeria sp. FSL L7-0233]|uniref:acyltransferase family protein n=1 Tax=Listeria cossartiae TaxID=2838249 RepID=UPI00162A6F1F|nr:acyltransferase family protein [Listeria cossartiae]MBC1543774.1 acetyltransferase [Listeria cossartiae subsp. cossartiae]MBC1569130.1 acetyltransferase [Listeria cossartiae subsp. cossartiae]MBC2182139.1 acetyltransferase [Listeria cossartiae subsp. cossartiae]MBC2186907.1 acetyltransferase [Listeria cossartiae subsp. cossartiae]MBC2193132.1 acetyltransferase [Listeria cossartiae subsp. cossartiae]